MKILDEIHAYQGQLSLLELQVYIQRLCDRINQSFHQGTGKVPVLALEKEKNSLHPLPAERVRSSYRIHYKLVKINVSNMISYQSRQYSVPTGYQGKTVGIQVYEDCLCRAIQILMTWPRRTYERLEVHSIEYNHLPASRKKPRVFRP